jgi:hypothetical protein
MAIQVYEVAYSTDKINFTNLTNVQSVNIRLGRQAMIDNFTAGTGTVVLRYPTGFASPIAQLVSGTFIRIKNTTTNRIQWTGVINDVEVAYDIPYVGGVGNGDYVTLSLEGGLAAFARSNGNSYAMASNPIDAQISNCSAQTGLTIISSFGSAVPPVLAASTVGSSWADWINTTNASINGRIYDYQGNLFWNGPGQIAPSTINFSDTTNNATNQVYDQINYDSLGQNFFTQVTVTPTGLAAQVASSGSAPFRNLGLATFNGSTGQALDLANYLLNTYKTPVNSISSISCNANAQASMQLDAIGTDVDGANFWSSISRRVSVTFRGQTIIGVIEGMALSATPESARYTFYLSPADLNAYLILNDTVFGRLDYNKLGY